MSNDQRGGVAEPALEADSQPEGSGNRGKRAVLWTVLGYGGSQVLRLVGNLILVRLLPREYFGLMVVVNTLLLGLELFSDLGIGQSLIQNKRGNEATFFRTAWTLQLIRGFVLWGVAVVGGVVAAGVYDEPRYYLMIPAAALSAIAAGTVSTQFYRANRSMLLGRVVLLDLAAQVVSISVMVTWALLDPSPWALVCGGVSAMVTRAIISHRLLPGSAPDRVAWDPDAVPQLLHFGKWIFVSTALAFLAGEGDRFAFGKMTDWQTLGVFSIAAVLAQVPAQLMGALASRVFLPLFSRAVRAGEDVNRLYLEVRNSALSGGGWLLSGVIGGAPTIVAILYPDSYSEAAWMLRVLACGIWFGVMLEGTNGVVLLAHGLPKWTAAGSAGKLIGMGIAMPIGYSVAGFEGALVGSSAAQVVRYCVSVYATRGLGLRGGPPQDLILSVVLGLACAASAYAATYVRGAGWGLATEAIVVFLVCTSIWAPHLLALAKRVIARPGDHAA